MNVQVTLRGALGLIGIVSLLSKPLAFLSMGFVQLFAYSYRFESAGACTVDGITHNA